jgi:hypothetical protein
MRIPSSLPRDTLLTREKKEKEKKALTTYKFSSPFYFPHQNKFICLLCFIDLETGIVVLVKIDIVVSISSNFVELLKKVFLPIVIVQ